MYINFSELISTGTSF